MTLLHSKNHCTKTWVLASTIALCGAACSSDDSDSLPANTAAPEASGASSEPGGSPLPANTAAEQAPADEQPEASAEASTEIPEGNIDLSQPAGDGVGSGAKPRSAPHPLDPGAPVLSAGCGSAAAVESGRFSIDVAGSPREYILGLPEAYDATRAHRLIFTWHARGGTAERTANNYYGLEALAEGSAIFVSPEGIDSGWANTGGRDIAFFDAMLDKVQSELCIDQTRIFSTGFSYGGMMSFAIACARADVVRAIASMSGALYSGCTDGDAPIAMLAFHGIDDTLVPIANGVQARDEIVERNGCEPESAAVESDGCLSFQGCSEGHSATWCEFNGGHTPPPQSATRIWDFFSEF